MISLSSGTRLGAAIGKLPTYWHADGLSTMIGIRRAYRMGFVEGGYSLAELVKLGVEANMERGIRGGSGNKAEKRRIRIVEHKMQEIRESLEGLRDRSAARLKQERADYLAEIRSEGRILRKVS